MGRALRSGHARYLTGSDVDAVAVKVAALNHHVAEVDANAQHDLPTSGGMPPLAISMASCNCDSALDCVYSAGELD